MRSGIILSQLTLSRPWARFRYRLGEVRWARAIRSGLRPAAERNLTERNIRYLYIEVFWAALFSAVFSFNTTYVLRLGATNQMVGLLSSLPSLFAVFLMVPSARFLETKSNRGPWLHAGLFIGRLVFWGMVLIPWLVKSHQAEWLVALLILRTIPITFFNTGFSPLMADVVPERRRAHVFSTRSIISSATVAAATFAAGLWLDAASSRGWAPFPLNYQIVYIVGSIGALTSALFVSRVKGPPTPVLPREPRPARERLNLRASLTTFRKELSTNRAFARLILNTLFLNLGAWVAMPLYTILYVRRLGASDGWIGLNSTLANVGVIAGYALFRRVINRWGDSRTLLLTVLPAATFPLLVGLFPDLRLILVWQVVLNFLASGLNLSHTNIFYKSCPQERRASYMAIYSTVINVGAFVCPMIGVALAELIDLRWVIVGGGVARLLGAAMFLVLPVDVEDAHAPKEDVHDDQE